MREWDWFIKQLVAIKTPKMVPGDKWFKELVVIFRRPQPPVTNVADKRRRRNPAVMPSWMDAQEERDRNKALEPLVMPFKPAIVRISILLLSDFDWTALVPVGHKKIYWISGTPAIVYGKRGGILQTLSVVGPIPKF